MNNMYLLFLFKYLFILSLMLWLVLWIFEFFFSKKNYILKNYFYECGFKSMNEMNLKLNYFFSLLCIFFMIYDMELFFLLMLFSNFYYFYYQIFFFFLLLFFLIFSLNFDWQLNNLDWQM